MAPFETANNEEIKTSMLKLLEEHKFLPVEILVREKRYMVTLGLHHLGFCEFIISLDGISSEDASNLMHQIVSVVLNTAEFSYLNHSEHFLIKDYFSDNTDETRKADLEGVKVNEYLVKEFTPLSEIVFGNLDLVLYQLFIPGNDGKNPRSEGYNFVACPQSVINDLVDDRNTVSDVAFTMQSSNTVH